MPIPISSMTAPGVGLREQSRPSGGSREAGTGACDRRCGNGRGAGSRLGVRRVRSRRARRRRHDGRGSSRHATQRAAQGVHRGAQRRLLDPGARREGRLERRRARQLRPVLHLLPGWRGGLRGRAACGIGRRQRSRRSRRRCTRAASARRSGAAASDEARAPLHGEDQRGVASRRSARGGDRRGGEPGRGPRPGVCERARDRARARELRGPAGRRRDRRRLHLASERPPPRMDAEGDRGRQARPRREALLAPRGRGGGGLGRGRARGSRRDGGVHVASSSAGCPREVARRGGRDRAALPDPDDLQLPAARPRQHPDGRGPRRRRTDGCRLLLRQRRTAPRRRAGAGLRGAGARDERRRRRLPRDSPFSGRRRRPVRRLVLAARETANGGRRRQWDARARGAVAGGLGRSRPGERRAGRRARRRFVRARASELRRRDRRRGRAAARPRGRARAGTRDRGALRLGGVRRSGPGCEDEPRDLGARDDGDAFRARRLQAGIRGRIDHRSASPARSRDSRG